MYACMYIHTNITILPAGLIRYESLQNNFNKLTYNAHDYNDYN